MAKYFQILFKSAFFLSLFIAFGQKRIYETQSITVKDGLTNSNTFNILQGKDNFIWMSTIGGLTRYDGYNFKHYDATFFKINEDATLFLALDKQKRIWFCEDKAYSTKLNNGVFNTETDSIHNFETISNGLFKSSEVFTLNASSRVDDVIFITTTSGVVYKYDGQFKQIYKIPQFRYRRVSAEVDTNNTYWITYDNNKITHVDSAGTILDSYEINIADFGIKTIIALEPYLVFESYDQKLKKSYWQIKNGVLKQFKIHEEKNFQLLEMSNSEMLFFNNDTLFRTTIKPFHQLKEKTPIAYLPNLKYNNYYKDKQGIIWITSNNGFYKIIPKANPFTVLQSKNSIRGITVKDNKLWVGGYKQSVVQNLAPQPTNYSKLPSLTATHFIEDKTNNLWMGTTVNQLYKLNIEDSTWSSYKSTPYRVMQVPHINPVTNRVWVGTDIGLSYVDNNNTIKNYEDFIKLNDAHIRQFLNTSEGLWIVTNKGLFLMDATSEKIIEHYSTSNVLPTNNINHIYKDKAGIFWLATKTEGLLRWQIKDNSIKAFSTSQGLSNNTIYAVYEDNYNHLWLPSNYGLMRFDKNSYDTQVFTKDDGIADNEFNTFAHFKAKDGTLYFGGINGITVFHPKDFTEQTNTNYPIYITDLKLLKKDADEFEHLAITNTINAPISVNYNDQILQFEFSLLDFKSTNKHQYAYKIEGYHNQWIHTRDNKISIFNFPYGAQTIRVKAKTNSDTWSPNELSIPIFVNKPLYLKWQFILATTLLTIFLFYAYVKWRLKKLNTSKLKLETIVKNRTQQIEADKQIIELQSKELEALDVAKDRFFTNLTHELRTPLTLIIGPLEQIVNNPPPKAILQRRVTGILNNAKHILGLINQLLDLSKIENKQILVEAVSDDIVAYTKILVDRFQPLATQQKQTLTFKSKENIWFTNFDKDKWEKIVYNLISNAIRFTPKNGAITVNLKPSALNKNDAIMLLVTDSGIGIEEKNLDAVFDRFYQVDLSSTRANDGTGVGLALVKELIELQKGTISIISKVGEGSTFKVVLPVLSNNLIKPYLPNQQNDFLIPAVKNTKDPSLINTEGIEKLDVLIVEDNEDIRDYILQCLGQQKYTVSMAKNGEEGLEKAMSLIPDLIISDVMMPKKNGFDLVEDIRKNISTSHIPIILLTAKGSLDSKLSGLKRGADSYLTKPFNPRELTATVQSLIEMRKRLQERYAISRHNAQGNDTYIAEDIFISQLRSYILEHLNEPDLNGDLVGLHFGLSRVHLYRKLKALTNESISEFVKKIRLERGLELLEKKQLNISEIAYETGFSSPSHFSRSFKEKYGKSPSQM